MINIELLKIVTVTVAAFVTVCHRLPSSTLVTVTATVSHGVETEPSQKRWKYFTLNTVTLKNSSETGSSRNLIGMVTITVTGSN